MEKNLRTKKIPETDSIQELARFWDSHDLTNFEQELDEVHERIFARVKTQSLNVNLPPRDLQRVRRLAKSKGLNETRMVRDWILERLHESL